MVANARAGASCTEILAQSAGTPSGSYTIRLASGGEIQVTCDMTTSGGGWTQLTSAFAASLDDVTPKEYLYTFGGRWYRSPVTTLAWDWSAGKELAGAYAYYDGAVTSVYTCTGSSEKPQFGVGCSSGPGNTAKTVPLYTSDPAGGTCTICQDTPNAFGGGVCQGGVAVFVR